MEHKTYTQAEISRNIEDLTNRMEHLKTERKRLNEKISSIKSQIDEWLKLDKSQLKMFE